MTLSSSAPGRICLFGEHQDYLGLPVTAAAINLCCRATLIPRSDRWAVFHFPDLGEVIKHDLDALPPLTARNYTVSVLRLARAEGWLPARGFDLTVQSDIPMAAGTSSSTAFVLALVAVIARAAGYVMAAQDCVEKAHHAEVTAFGEPGGRMDHVACGLGGLRRVSFTPALHSEAIAPLKDVAWVLGDSLTPKDTLRVLHRAKTQRENLLAKMPEDFDLATAAVLPPTPGFTAEERRLLQATLDNRNISAAGTRALMTGDAAWVGAELVAHHAVLRDDLGLSTPRIEAMLEQAMKHGAFGGKINGSGGGGCCFVLCRPDDAESIAAAMTAAGGLGMPIDLSNRGVLSQTSAMA